MIFRTTVVAIAVVLGAYAAVAQVDAITARKAIMKANGDQAKAGAAMAKGEAPFDLARAKAIFVQFQDASAKFGDLFPPNSKSGGETAALPKIWEDMADFKAKLVKFGADAKAAEGSTKDLDTFKAAFTGVTKNCGGCHETYRAKKS